MKFSLGCISIIFTWIISILSKALILYLFWDWFIISTFSGLSELSFMKAIAISTFIEVIFKDSLFIKTESNNPVTQILVYILSLAIIISTGFIIHLIL